MGSVDTVIHNCWCGRVQSKGEGYLNHTLITMPICTTVIVQLSGWNVLDKFCQILWRWDEVFSCPVCACGQLSGRI